MEACYLYTLDQVAEMTGLSERWLADRCRADKIDHTRIEHRRRMTMTQIELLLEQHRVQPGAEEAEEAEAERKLQERLAAKHRRHPKG